MLNIGDRADIDLSFDKPSRLGPQNMPISSLLKDKTPSKCPGYDTKPSDGEAPVLKL